jgi:hypothetical protein
MGHERECLEYDDDASSGSSSRKPKLGNIHSKVQEFIINSISYIYRYSNNSPTYMQDPSGLQCRMGTHCQWGHCLTPLDYFLMLFADHEGDCSIIRHACYLCCRDPESIGPYPWATCLADCDWHHEQCLLGNEGSSSFKPAPGKSPIKTMGTYQYFNINTNLSICSSCRFQHINL